MRDLWWPSLNSPGHPEVLCVGHAGAWPGVFRPLARHLDGKATVRALCLPGRDRRLAEPLLSDPHAVTAKALSGVDAPALLVGVCTGAYLAWRFAEQLGTAALVTVGAAAAGQTQRLLELSALEDDAIRLRLLRSGATSPALLEDEEFSEVIVAAYRADIMLAADPLPEARLRQPIIAVGGVRDEITDAELGSWGRFSTVVSAPYRVPEAGHWVVTEQPERFAEWLSGLL